MTALAPRVHGGLPEHGLGSSGDGRPLVDFSVNVNPYGPSPAVAAAAAAAPLTRYPEPSGLPARAALAASFELAPERLAVGNGAVALLWTAVHALLEPGEVAAVVAPTFSEFAAAVSARPARLRPIGPNAAARASFAFDLDHLDRELARLAPRLVYLCNPNNPTGAALPMRALEPLLADHPRTRFLLDQSFLSLSEHAADLCAPAPNNTVLLRSLTKDHGVPGLRIGYVVADPDLVRRIEACRPPWSTSAPAIAAMVAGATEAAFLADSRRRLLADRDATAAALRQVGFAPFPSAANFLLVRAPGATDLRRRLFQRHAILVRDGTSFGLPDHLRLAARPAADRARLLVALAQELRP